MKICYISNASSTGKSASTVHPSEDARSLSKWAEVHFITSDIFPLEDNIKFYPLGQFSVPPKRLWYAIRLLRLLNKVVRINNIDIIYARQPGSGLLGHFIGNKYKKPVICEINDLAQIGRYYNSRKTFFSWLSSKYTPFLMSLYLWIAAKRVDYFITVTDNIKKHLINDYKVKSARITVISNGANTILFHPINISEARLCLNLSAALSYIGFAGSLYYWQGLHNLLNCVPLVIEKYANIKFLIAGDGPLKSGLIEQSKRLGVYESLIFTGAVQYEKIPTYINACDICVVPKIPLKSGYSPLKLYEYMACGKPVVATRTDGFEILEENNAGILINPQNPEEFAGALIKLLRDEELRKQMGENGRKYVVENHSWESIAKRKFQVCQEVVDEYRRTHKVKNNR